jgi:transcriptional regulator with XRE-family HTH domain
MYSHEFKITRQSLKLTQKELAEKLGVSRYSVIRYENGQTKISKRTELLLKTFKIKTN